MQQDRKRSANYTQREKDLLLNLLQKYLKILENKKTNAVFNKQKNECWEKLAEEYNSVQTTGFRTGQQLKSCYEQIKKIAKQHKAEDKVELVKTGGGTFTPKTSTMDHQVLTRLQGNFFLIDNKFDSNCTVTTANSDKENIQSNDEGAIILSLNQEDTTDSPSLELMETPTFKKRKTEIIEEREGSKKNISKGKGNEINLKQFEICNVKLDVLKTIAQIEIERLKGVQLDNEIKQIIKQRELINLQLKEKELENLNNKK